MTSFIPAFALYVLTAHIAFTGVRGTAPVITFIAASAANILIWLYVSRTAKGPDDLWFKALVWDTMIFAAYFLYPIFRGHGNIAPLQICLAAVAFLCILLVKVV